jgi:pimeloyl-ACP methyl ester carboxylesterase
MTTRRWLKIAAILLAVGVIMAIGGVLGARAIAQSQNAQALAIRDPNGIDEQRFVRIGGQDQWVTIRGRDRDNPVILIVGGLGADGPGAVASPFLGAFQAWEHDFTVVQWDHRGAGKTFARAGRKLDPDLGVELISHDAMELTDYLRKRLQKRKIVLLGVGFGSTIAARLALDHPQAYSAYVAAGQIADRRVDRQAATHRRLMQLATAGGDQTTMDDLRLAGPHPFADTPRNPEKLAAFGRASGRYHARNPPHQERDVLTAPHWSLGDALSIRAGMHASEAKFGRSWDEGFDYPRLRGTFRMPVAVVQGDLDLDAPLALSRAWLDQVEAPAKVLVAIPGAGTHALQTDPDAFLRVLRGAVYPWATKDQ